MAAASSSSSSGPCWKYDVFLNFRGEDTRKVFVGHLYKALDQKAIDTFIDAEDLRKGDTISELLKVIQESRLSIVVFSQNYASSTWCLKELVQILQCMDTDKQIVVPVFYEVDPSDVRKLKRSFAEAFDQIEADSNAGMEELESWKSALTRAANFSGWDSRNYKDDAKLIEEIVEDIFNKFIQISSSKPNDLVGMESHLSNMALLLCPGEDDVRFVGIWGMAGIGKTTIARAVYDGIACQFEAYCFLENVREGFSKNGAVHMQEELLSRILKEKVQSLGSLDRGSKMILAKLGKKKVFLVLDDVDNIDQIEALLGKQRSFGGGSRIIITTRSMESLTGVDKRYMPQLLKDDEALDLFTQYAFRTNKPTRDYNHLTSHAIDYAQGLPLAIKVLGAFLDSKSLREWKDVLEKIRNIPNMGIHSVLRTSFDGLDDSEKDIFLDVACFFKGMEKDYATKILDSCGFFPHSGLRVLVDRALITISRYSTLEMHDLLEEMGREIVRQESIREPGRRSRLWNYKDVHHVLTQNTVTEAVESIILNLENPSKEVDLNTEAFVRLTRLRLLRIGDSHSIGSDDEDLSGEEVFHPCYRQHLIGDLKFLSHELRCLFWHGYPLKSLPSHFDPKNLVDLDMQYSHIEQLWEGIKPLRNLEFINLSHSKYLKKTPDFSEVTNLEKLILEDCTSLCEVHPSISALKKLVFLSLKGCEQLSSFPSSIHMKSLKSLSFSGCTSLEKFPEISEVMEELSELFLNETAFKELPSSIKNLTGLKSLNLSGCTELKGLPSSIHMRSLKTINLSGCSKFQKFEEIQEVTQFLLFLNLDGTAIKQLPSSIEYLTGLCILGLKGCQELKSLPSSVCKLKLLSTLDLSGCSNLESFPEIPEMMQHLIFLILDRTAIKELPSSIENLTRLVTLSLKGCQELKSLPISIGQLKRLSTLTLSGCSNLESFPEISEVTWLHMDLHLDRTAIKELPSPIENLTRLFTLNLKGCQELKSVPSSIFQLKYLHTLTLSGCTNLESFPEVSEVMQCLSYLHLDRTGIKELPSSIENLTGLVTLSLKACRELKSLPSSICQLKRLSNLTLSGCSNLESFPEISEVMDSFLYLHLERTAIRELPSSIENLTGLVTLNLKGCLNLKSLPSSISQLKRLRTLTLSGCLNLESFPEISEVMQFLLDLHLDRTAIKELPSSIENLTGLFTLSLKGCRELKSLPSSIFQLKRLDTLTLSGCSNLESFPEISKVMRFLSYLHLDRTGIKELPSSIENLTGFVTLSLKACRELKSLPSSICQLKRLSTLTLSGCSNLESFPEISEVMKFLLYLHLDGTAIRELPSSIGNLTRLWTLSLKGCRELKILPSSICQLKRLNTLTLSRCSNLVRFPEISEVMDSFLYLHLERTAIRELPSSIENLTGLVTLNLKGCLNLKRLPSSISQLKCLRTLTLSGCSNLESFPEISEVMQLPSFRQDCN